jgi:hypothetical protein
VHVTARRASTVAHDVGVAASLLRRLPGFLRNPVTVGEARATLEERLARRDADFLALVRRSIYGQRDGPYRALLDEAGVAAGDVERLVRDDGVDGALRALHRAGVYLTADEFKGRAPVRRGRLTLSIDPADLRNPASSAHLMFHTSGRTGHTQVVSIDLAQLRHEAVDLALFLDARGGGAWVHGIYGVPGTSIVRIVMRVGAVGAPLVRWFSQLDPAGGGLDARYRWSARLMRIGGALARVPIPAPEHVPLERPRRIVSWMAGLLAAGTIPHLWAFASSAVRVCDDAVAAGIRLDGAQFTVLGEPLTAAKLAAIHRVGASAASYYSSIESGHIAYACQAPAAVDDMHVLHDLYAVVQPGESPPGSSLPADALLVSALGPATPFVMLNVSLGDRGTMEDRACGCALMRLGWTRHLHGVRSYEKVTAAGMTLRDADVARVLEEILPARFGGAPTHYQLVEDEDDTGRARLRLLVHPAVGTIDTAAVTEAFLAAVGAGMGPDRVVEMTWRAGGILGVERTPPRPTKGGKILHLLDGRQSA